MTTAIHGRHTTITRAGFTFIPRGEIAGPAKSVELVDATNFASTIQEFVADPMEMTPKITFETEYDGTAPTVGGAAVSTVITYPNAKTATCDTILESWEPKTPMNGVMTASVTLQRVSAVVFA